MPSASVGQSFSKKARACDVSSAGMMPSSLDNLWNAAIFTEKHQAANEITKDTRGSANIYEPKEIIRYDFHMKFINL